MSCKMEVTFNSSLFSDKSIGCRVCILTVTFLLNLFTLELVVGSNEKLYRGKYSNLGVGLKNDEIGQNPCS